MEKQQKQHPKQPIPQAPEGYPEPVRRELEQYGQTHEGRKEPAQDVEPGTSGHMGATETAVTPSKPPMNGPADLVGKKKDRDDDDIDPAEELTPG